MIDNDEVDKWQEISTHTARRSFAMNAYLSRSMDAYQIVKCTGHKTETSFLNPDYALGSGHHSITDEFFELSGFNLDNENHPKGCRGIACKLLIFIRQIMQ